MKVYIAGPMTGILDHNYPAFEAAAARWREKGHLVFSPNEQHAGHTGFPLVVYARHDVHLLLQVDAIALLPGWERSRGAKLEVLLGEWLGLNFFDAVTFEAIAPRVATTAEPIASRTAA